MQAADALIRRARPWLGTIVEIGVPPEHETAIEVGFAEIARIHRLMSFHEDTSDLAKLRAAVPGEVIALDADTVAVLQIANDLHHATDGLFNIAIGCQLVRTRFLPRMAVAHLAQFDGGASDIEIVDARRVQLQRRTMIDLGGIAKGYAVDCAVRVLQRAGVEQGIVNAGGDLRVFGDDPVPVEVRMAPDALGGSGYSTAFAVQNAAVASSENTRARRTVAGKIATPHIGLDTQAIIVDQTITVMASTCVIADAMTKVAMIDPDLADRLLAAHDGHVVRFEMCEAA